MFGFARRAARATVKVAKSVAKDEIAYFKPIVKKRFKDKRGPELRQALHNFLCEVEGQTNESPAELASYLRSIADELENNQTQTTGF